jgi:hypothetical protein
MVMEVRKKPSFCRGKLGFASSHNYLLIGEMEQDKPETLLPFVLCGFADFA